MSSYGLAPDQFSEWVKQSREAQGLTPEIDDPSTLHEVARLLHLPDQLDPRRVEAVTASDGRRRNDDPV